MTLTDTTPVPSIAEDRDELDAFIDDETSKDPAFAAAYVDAQRRAEIFEILAGRRRAAGLSQAQVAQLMGTTQSAVSDLERRTPDVILSTLHRYARAVGTRFAIDILPAESEPIATDR